MTDRHRSKGVAHFCRTGVILPGYAGEVAAYLARRRDVDDPESVNRPS